MNYGLDMQLRSIFEEAECAAAFDRILPGMRQLFGTRQEALGLSLRTLAAYTGGRIPPAALTALEKALREIGERNGGISPAERERIQDYQAFRAADNAAELPTESHRQDAVYPGMPWLDVTGKRIQAHAGGFLYENGLYYWYGENKAHTDGKSQIWTWGIRLYSSSDFYNWTDRGLIISPVLDDPNSQLFPEKRVDRPHIVKNPNTGKYVCWYKNSGPDACFNVLTADELTGPWELVHSHYNPFGLRVGDFDLTVDEETGTGYVYCEANHNTLKGLRLNREYTQAERIVSTQYDGINPPFTREGVSVFRREGKLWMLTSGMTGYVPNQSDSAVSEGYEQPFVPVGDPHVDDDTLASFNSQIGQVFRVPGKKDLYLAVADRWVPGYPVDRELALSLRRAISARYDSYVTASAEDQQELASSPNLATANTSLADYVILPITFENGVPKIRWRDRWTLEEFE